MGTEMTEESEKNIWLPAEYIPSKAAQKDRKVKKIKIMTNQTGRPGCAGPIWLKKKSNSQIPISWGKE